MTSTDLEDRLRRNLAAEAARTQASMLSPLTEPETMTRRAVAGWRASRGPRRWLAPAFALVAIAAVLAGVTLASSAAGLHRRAASGGAAPGRGATPRFYVSLTWPSSNPKWRPMHVRMLVHEASTGRVVSSVRLPGVLAAGHNPAIAAAASDRVFDVAEITRQSPSWFAVRLIEVAISNRGRPESISSSTPLLRWPGPSVEGLALSPDGSKLAVAEYTPTGLGEIQVFSHGGIQSWKAASGIPLDPVWQAGGRELGFLWRDHMHSTAENFSARTRERLLDVAAPGDGLLTNSKVIAAGPGGQFLESAVLSADGRTLLGTWYRNIPGTHGRGVAVVGFGRVGLYGRRSVVIEHWVIQYRGPAQENAADLSCRVLSVAGRDPAALLRCPIPDPFHHGDRVVLERFQDNYFAALPSAGASPVVAW
ncbi:MAG TPA: hypothetical protein VHU92_25475 [Streptosporangiaceae bacterium]|nr:hypothetical protein [Streptosporangiaceae bacterium]